MDPLFIQLCFPKQFTARVLNAFKCVHVCVRRGNCNSLHSSRLTSLPFFWQVLSSKFDIFLPVSAWKTLNSNSLYLSPGLGALRPPGVYDGVFLGGVRLLFNRWKGDLCW